MMTSGADILASDNCSCCSVFSVWLLFPFEHNLNSFRGAARPARLSDRPVLSFPELSRSVEEQSELLASRARLGLSSRPEWR